MAGPIVLNVAEKPSVARALADVFRSSPGAQSRNNHSNGPTPIFECDNVRFPCLDQQGNGRLAPNNARVEGHTMITTAVRGHLASSVRFLVRT